MILSCVALLPSSWDGDCAVLDEPPVGRGADDDVFLDPLSLPLDGARDDNALLIFILFRFDVIESISRFYVIVFTWIAMLAIYYTYMQ